MLCLINDQRAFWSVVAVACFGWLAVRHLRGLPFSLPTTTGASVPSVGGVRVRA